MIYKTLKKVSDYCQPLDKSKYPKTQTVYGVTFTNNGDGTITVNGTATEDAFMSAGAIGVIKGHKYLWKGTPVGGALSTFHSYITGNVEQFYIDTGSGTISTATDDGVTYGVLARVKFGTTVSNLTFKPQLFDLTEMYGAGHEPTTVEEFRSKFPNDLYDYSPRCFVTSYKDCLKVSDYCQLLDKRKYPATTTVAGVTFTNNGDGTITVNGTATDRARYVLFNSKYFSSTLIGHKCLLEYNVPLSEGGTIMIHSENWDISNQKPISEITSLSAIIIDVFQGNTVNNLVFKPQFFDLTEMYGAGNEPTTVEQFRADFPDELYDYKPYSIVPSYKKSLACKTKNLFDINSANVMIKDDGSFVSKAEHTSHFYSLNVTPGETYTVSYYTTSFGSIGSGLNLSVQTGDHYRDGVQIFFRINPRNPDTYINGTFTIPEGATKITFSCLMGSSSYKNFMLELGDIATEYHPYGYL